MERPEEDGAAVWVTSLVIPGNLDVVVVVVCVFEVGDETIPIVVEMAHSVCAPSVLPKEVMTIVPPVGAVPWFDAWMPSVPISPRNMVTLQVAGNDVTYDDCWKE